MTDFHQEAEASQAALLAQLAHECDRLLPAPLGLGSCDRSLVLLTVEGGRPRICATVQFSAGIVLDPGLLAEEVARRLGELQELVGEATACRWPLDEGTGGVVQVVRTGGVLRVRFVGATAEVRFHDIGLPPAGPSHVAG